MSQFARPSADLSIGSWTETGGGGTDLFLEIDETSASDTDYVRSSDSSNDSLWVRLSTINDPGIDTGHVFRYRYRKSASGGNDRDLSVSLVVGDHTSSSLVIDRAHTGISDTWVTETVNLAELDAVSITDYSDLAIKLEAGGTTGGSPGDLREVHVSWAELETPSATISPNDCLHSHTAESPTVSNVVAIAPNDCLHAHTAESPVLPSSVSITPNDCLHAHSSDSPTVTFSVTIAPNGCTHSHTADQPTVTTTNVGIIPDDCTHSHSADATTVTTDVLIAPDDCLHAHTVDAVSVMVAGDPAHGIYYYQHLHAASYQ